MTNEERAKWIKGIFMVVVLGGALTAGLILKLPGLGERLKGRKDGIEQVTQENFRDVISQPDKLVVINMWLDGNRDAEKLAAILERLRKERTFGDKVVYAELNVKRERKLATQEAVEFDGFAGQLNFYSEGERLGILRNETDPVVVEETIRRYLSGLVKRTGPGWLPEVEGMQPMPRTSSPPGVPAEPSE